MARMTDCRFPKHVLFVDPREIHSWKSRVNEDIEEFPLLLQSSEVRELIEAARQEGLSAAGLVRCLIRDYLLCVRSNSEKSRRLRLVHPGEDR